MWVQVSGDFREFQLGGSMPLPHIPDIEVLKEANGCKPVSYLALDGATGFPSASCSTFLRNQIRRAPPPCAQRPA